MVHNKTLIRREVRGVSFVATHMFTPEFRGALKTLVTKLQEDFKLVNAALFCQAGEFVAGHKFNDTDQVVDRILRTISSEFALWEGATPKEIAQVESLERQYLGVWAWDGLRDSASSDHWYMYEKKYD